MIHSFLTTAVTTVPIYSFIGPLATIVFVVIGGMSFGWFRILKETNKLLKEQNNELKIANAELLLKHNEGIATLASMQGQIDVLKSIPLVNIDITLKEIAKFNKLQSESNAKILATLEASAATLAKDTAHAADAAEEVKSDLKKSK